VVEDVKSNIWPKVDKVKFWVRGLRLGNSFVVYVALLEDECDEDIVRCVEDVSSGEDAITNAKYIIVGF